MNFIAQPLFGVSGHFWEGRILAATCFGDCPINQNQNERLSDNNISHSKSITYIAQNKMSYKISQPKGGGVAALKEPPPLTGKFYQSINNPPYRGER